MDSHDPISSKSFAKDSQSAAQTGLVAIVFTDLVASTAMKQQWGDVASASVIQKYRQLVRQTLNDTKGGEEIETAGDSFLLIFTKPSEAVRFALLSGVRIRELSQQLGVELADRIAIHMGEVVVEQHAEGKKAKDLYGIQVDTCARLLSLAAGGQILMTRAVFESARHVLRGEEIPGITQLRWESHGRFALKGIEEPVEVCEVGEAKSGCFVRPSSQEKASRLDSTGSLEQLDWPPAPGTVLVGRYQVGERVGAGGMGSVHQGMDLNLERKIALKFMSAEFTGSKERFKRKSTNLITVDFISERACSAAAILQSLRIIAWPRTIITPHSFCGK